MWKEGGVSSRWIVNAMWIAEGDAVENEKRARVFISCGQRRDTDEVQVARNVEASFRSLGFDPYVAVEEQTLRGVTENIFRQIETSEYFVFIDFKREHVAEKSACRGSLFSHQELAVATYLDLQIIAFREKGVIQEDGIMRFLQANSTEFTDRHLLKDSIIARANERKWSPERRNKLYLEANGFIDARDINRGDLLRVFHVNVTNRHRTKAAIGCYVYLEQITNTRSNEAIFAEPVEVKWKGYNFPMANIAPHSSRSFDAVCLWTDQPDEAFPHVLTDFTGYSPRLKGPAEYTLQYLVLAENFPPEQIRLELRLGSTLPDVCLRPMGQS